MHTCISSHGLKRSRHSCPRWVNAGNKNTPSTHHPRRRNVTTLMVGLKRKRSHTQKSHPKVVNPRDIAGERKKNKTKQKNPKKEKKARSSAFETDALPPDQRVGQATEKQSSMPLEFVLSPSPHSALTLLHLFSYKRERKGGGKERERGGGG